MKVTETELPGLRLVEPERFADQRGYFEELWHQRRYREANLPGPFVQDNISFSRKGVLRGLHFQHPSGQGKLISVLQGEVYDVAVDIRQGTPTFGQWLGLTLSGENGRQLYIPEGFAHGFVVTGEQALVLYKCTAFYAPEHEHTIAWNDPDLAIDWPVADPILSEKDATAPLLREFSDEALPSVESR